MSSMHIFAALAVSALLIAANPTFGETNSAIGYNNEAQWNNASIWSLGRVPTASDDIFLQSITIILDRVDVTVLNMTVDRDAHVIVTESTLTITDSILVVGGGLVSFTGNSSTINANYFNIINGVLTGSGLINTTRLLCDSFCEIDVLRWETAAALFVESTGSLTINGDVRFPSLSIRVTERTIFTRPILVLGASQETGSTIYSRFLVNGKVYLDDLLVSLLFLPDAASFGQSFPRDSFVASGGFIVANETVSPIAVLPQKATDDNHKRPPFVDGIHIGRSFGRERGAPTENLGGLNPPSSSQLTNSNCGQTSSTSLVIIFGSTSCTTCAPGFVYSTSAGRCIPNCVDPTCSGHGTCIDLGGSAGCSCGTGWTGTNCQLPDCPVVGGFTCNLRGTCAAPTAVGQPATCSCNSGFVPPFCLPDIVINSPSSSTNGSSLTPTGDYICGGTTCARGADGCTALDQCRCMANFTGSRCETPQCPNACSGRGDCDGSRTPPVCSCIGNYKGADCSEMGQSGSDPNAIIAGIDRNAFTGIMSAVGFVVLALAVLIIVFTVNRRAKAAARPFAQRVLTQQDNL